MTLLLAALAVALAGCSDDSSDDGTTVTITINNASIAGKTFTYSDTSGGYENTITFGNDGKTFTYTRTYTGTTGEGSGTGTGSGTINDFSDTQSVVFGNEDSAYPLDTISEAITLTFTAADSGLTGPDTTWEETISAGSKCPYFSLYCCVKKSGEVIYATLSSLYVGWSDSVFKYGDVTL